MALLAALSLTGCVYEYSSEPDGEKERDLFLLLKVALTEEGTPVATTTRAEDVDYELPSFDPEKLHTLRVIIVDKATNRIVHNRFERMSSPTTISSSLRFKVDFSTDYYVYLIGNEEGFPGINAKEVFSDNMKEGTAYMVDALEKLVITGTPGQPPINNNGETKTPIPMSEKFEIRTIDKPEKRSETGTYDMSKTLFITRAFSKFTFNLFRSADYQGDNEIKLEKIKLYGLGSKEYLLPNETEYVPSKYEESTNRYEGRYIKSFAVPANSPVSEWEYPAFRSVDAATLPVWSEQNAGMGRKLEPQFYFAESLGLAGDDKFMCSITFDGKEYLKPLTLPNLPSLPRNTHVVVNIIVGNHGALIFKVKVLPWEPRYLEIDFTHNVGIAEDGALSLNYNTYESFDKKTGRVVLRDYPQATSGSFGISTPVGARWDAYLVTTAGELNQIQFQTTDENGKTVTTPHISGIIDGHKTNFKVVATSSAGASVRSAILQVMVTTSDGLSIPVNILKSEDYGADLENITFIQNPQ